MQLFFESRQCVRIITEAGCMRTQLLRTSFGGLVRRSQRMERRGRRNWEQPNPNHCDGRGPIPIARASDSHLKARHQKRQHGNSVAGGDWRVEGAQIQERGKCVCAKGRAATLSCKMRSACRQARLAGSV